MSRDETQNGCERDYFNYYPLIFNQCRALYRRMKQTEKTKQELAKSLKTATTKVGQLEVSLQVAQSQPLVSKQNNVNAPYVEKMHIATLS